MDEVRLNRIAERYLSDDDHLTECFLFGRAHESFAMSVEIWAPWRQDDGFHATVLQQRIERLRILVLSQICFFERLGICKSLNF